MTYHQLRAASIEESKRLQLKKKCSSISFANSIKKKYNIVSRRIQERRNYIKRTEEELITSANNFVNEINQLLPNYQSSNVFNSDQSGFNYEPSKKRTLEIKNSKLVSCHVNSPNNDTTHSYTIQIYISLDGSLGKRFYVVLREKDKTFGPQIQREINGVVEKCKNVAVVRCTKSGKMDKEKLKEWVDLFKDDNDGNKLLLWDSWRAQNNSFGDALLEIKQIPEKTTKYCQPLDSLFFIQYKYLFNHIFFRLRDEKINPKSRSTIIKSHAIVYNQMNHPKFKDLIRASWLSCGYQSNEDDPVVKNYFKTKNICVFQDQCEESGCCNDGIIRCIYCSKCLCSCHLLINQLHLH